ncbi:MAG: hypothetical protein U0869_06505 [Chloroflexota bacterium]
MGEGMIRGRPLGIWMIVILQLVSAGINILDVAFGTNLTDSRFQATMTATPVAKWFVLAWAIFVIVASLWLLSLRKRGWALMMLLVGLSLAVHLSVWWNTPQDTAWVRFAIAVVTAFYLNSAQVRRLFEDRHEVSRITIGGRPDE